MEETLGTYEITDYIVDIDHSTEERQLITYYKFNGEVLLAERYYGEVRPGFIPIS